MTSESLPLCFIPVRSQQTTCASIVHNIPNLGLSRKTKKTPPQFWSVSLTKCIEDQYQNALFLISWNELWTHEAKRVSGRCGNSNLDADWRRAEQRGSYWPSGWFLFLRFWNVLGNGSETPNSEHNMTNMRNESSGILNSTQTSKTEV